MKTVSHARALLRVWLMKHALVALTGGSGLVGVNARNNQQFVLGCFLNFHKTVGVVEHRFLVVSGTRSDNDKKLVAFSCNDIFYFLIALCLGGNAGRR